MKAERDLRYERADALYEKAAEPSGVYQWGFACRTLRKDVQLK